MNKIGTSIEQSKKLVELGIDVNTADIVYNIFDESYIRHDTPIDKYHTPSWSLSALIELIPDECRMEKTPLDQTGEFTYSFVDDYYNIRTYETGNPVDACYEMILKLKEKDLI